MMIFWISIEEKSFSWRLSNETSLNEVAPPMLPLSRCLSYIDVHGTGLSFRAENLHDLSMILSSSDPLFRTAVVLESGLVWIAPVTHSAGPKPG